MISEIMAEASPAESNESEDWESDEAFDESDEGVEDIGERARRRRRGPPSRYRPIRRGVKGVVMRGQDGTSRNVRFPAKLATAEETNQGLASQELGRRALEEKVALLEKRFGVQQKNDSGVAGLVTLGIGGSLAAHGVIKAKEQPDGLTLKNWTKQTSTEMATLISVTQLATSGAKLVVNGRYHRSGLGIAADVFAAAQIAAFAFGHFSVSKSESQARFFANQDSANSVLQGLSAGTTVLIGTSPGKPPTVHFVMEDSVLVPPQKFLVAKT